MPQTPPPLPRRQLALYPLERHLAAPKKICHVRCFHEHVRYFTKLLKSLILLFPFCLICLNLLSSSVIIFNLVVSQIINK